MIYKNAPQSPRTPRTILKWTARFMLGLIFALSFWVAGLAGNAQPAVAAQLDVAAHPPTEPLVLTDQDKADIKRIEDYLNSIGTLKSRFMQMTSQGDMSEGDFYLSRPGRLRIDYDDPVPILIISNGIFLLYEDTELEQKSYTTLDSTPASVLVQENIRLNGGGMVVTRIKRGANAFRISLANKEDPYSGVITLVFTDRPLMLRQWTIFDAQGTITDFALIEPRFGLELDPELFKFSMQSKDRRKDN